MQEIKIQNFERDRGQSFPAFRSLSPDQCAALRERVAQKLGLPPETDPLELVRHLAAKEGRYSSQQADEASFDLGKAMDELGIKPKDTIYLNWYRYDDVDEMSVKDLSKFFDDIWYPSSDDLDIFDDSLQWILSIAHDGDVKAIAL
jgi:hypothetical protein